MTATPPADEELEGHPTADGPLPEFVDWLLGAVVALGAAILLVCGTALVFLVDRADIEAGVEEGTITVTVGATELTDAETISVADAVVSWTGVGLILTGIAMLLFAAGFVAVRHRAHRRAGADEGVGSYGTIAVLGAIVTVVLSFVPISPALGGALAGYLERGESDRTVSVGALAGVLPLVPVVAIFLSVTGGLIAGLLTVGQVGNAAVLGTTLLLAALLVAAVGAGLGAFGGYVGGRLAVKRATGD